MRSFIATLLMVLFFVPAMAQDVLSVPAAVKTYVPNAKIVGQGRLYYVVWGVYDAVLYAPDGKYAANKPFALSLTYLRDFNGSDIADRSAEEIRAQGESDELSLAAWHEQMNRVFPNVKQGTVLTGIFTKNGTTVILKDGKKVGSFNDPRFGQYFFNIWLGKKTSAPALRQKLLGLQS